MSSAAPDTLAAFQARPFSTPVNLGLTPLFDAMPRIAETRKKSIPGAKTPEVEALRFYYLNHMVALVAQERKLDEPLGKYLPLVERYYTTQTLSAARMIWYLLYITTREARHWKKKTATAISLAKTHDAASVQFLQGASGDEKALFNKLVNKPPPATLGAYVETLSGCFYQKVWGSNPSFGGPNWGSVSDCLLRYVNGEVSAEATLDTAFTLAHNNGPIFNKGEAYSGYGEYFLKILDRQAAGSIPSYLAKGQGKTWVSKDHALAMDLDMGQSLFPAEHEGNENFKPSKKKHPAMKHQVGHTHTPNIDEEVYTVDAFKTAKIKDLGVPDIAKSIAEMKANQQIIEMEKIAKAMDQMDPGDVVKTLGSPNPTLGEALKNITADAVMDTDDVPDSNFMAIGDMHTKIIGIDYAAVEEKLTEKPKKKKKKIKFNPKGKIS